MTAVEFGDRVGAPAFGAGDDFLAFAGVSALVSEIPRAGVPRRRQDVDTRVEAARAALAAGRMVLLTSTDGRADLVGVASATTETSMAFLVRHSSGFVCVALPSLRADELSLPAMAVSNQSGRGTDFAVTVDAATGVTTGISAADRARTVQLLASDSSVGDDFHRPGHIVPIRTADDGVLVRPGHSEAAVDLVRLAGRPAVAVLAAVHLPDAHLLDSAAPAERNDAVAAFAATHGLETVSVDDVVRYRRHRQPLVVRGGQARLPVVEGQFTAYGYRGDDDSEHLALVHGDPADTDRAVVVVHRESVVADAFGVIGSAPTVSDHLALLAQADCGVLVYLRSARTGATGMIADFRRMFAQDSGVVPLVPGDPEPHRTALMTAQILDDLGICTIDLRSATAELATDLTDLGLDVVGSAPVGRSAPRR